jgi:hypothetical protein
MNVNITLCWDLTLTSPTEIPLLSSGEEPSSNKFSSTLINIPAKQQEAIINLIHNLPS